MSILTCVMVMTGMALATPAADPPWRAFFDRSDAAINEGRGYSEALNESGTLAWGESYQLMAYAEMYQATGDRAYLRRLVEHFDRVLQNRDDVRGKVDEYAGRPLAGWGSEKYSDGKWHVWIVHTGMITLGPAEFVRVVHDDPELAGEFGAKAAEYGERIAECIRDAEPYWRDGPGMDEGYYLGAHLNALLPLNQQNALDSVLIEMDRATGDAGYRRKARRLARFFRNRLRTPAPDVFDWAYWPREEDKGRGSEDISHAAINVDFAARCAGQGIVFTRTDIERFARTWLQQVKRPDGSYAGTVGGGGNGEGYMPYSAGLWLSLCQQLPAELAATLCSDAAAAFSADRLYGSSEMLGLARLERYCSSGPTPRQ